MSLSNLMGLLQQYANPGSTPANPEKDFEQVSQSAPQSHIADGLAEAFRSDQTPPFPQMLATLFGNSSGQQRAGILNQLLNSAGPAVAGSGILGNLLHGGAQVTPQQAQQVPPAAVHQLAAQAEKNDPSIVNLASNFYAQHPQVVQTLGAASLVLIMSHISRRI